MANTTIVRCWVNYYKSWETDINVFHLTSGYLIAGNETVFLSE